jgi:hypothetical protein
VVWYAVSTWQIISSELKNAASGNLLMCYISHALKWKEVKSGSLIKNAGLIKYGKHVASFLQ